MFPTSEAHLKPFLTHGLNKFQHQNRQVGWRLFYLYHRFKSALLFCWGWVLQYQSFWRVRCFYFLSLFLTPSRSPLYLLGYIPAHNRVYLVDKDMNLYGYSLSLTVVEYQTAILRGDTDSAAEILPSVPKDQLNKVARFLEGRGSSPLTNTFTRFMMFSELFRPQRTGYPVDDRPWSQIRPCTFSRRPWYCTGNCSHRSGTRSWRQVEGSRRQSPRCMEIWFGERVLCECWRPKRIDAPISFYGRPTRIEIIGRKSMYVLIYYFPCLILTRFISDQGPK